MTNGNGTPPEAGPFTPIECAGPVHQRFLFRESQRTRLAHASATAAGDQYSDQCRRQQYGENEYEVML